MEHPLCCRWVGRMGSICKPSQPGSLHNIYLKRLIFYHLTCSGRCRTYVHMGGRRIYVAYVRCSYFKYFNASELKECFDLCAGNSPVTGELPTQRPATRSFDVFFELRLNQQLSKQWRRRWFETPSRSLWRHCNLRTDAEFAGLWRIHSASWPIGGNFYSPRYNKLQRWPQSRLKLHCVFIIGYPEPQNVELDRENVNHNMGPGEWGGHAPMYELYRVRGPNQATTEATREEDYPRLWLNSPAGDVPWQQGMILTRRQ